MFIEKKDSSESFIMQSVAQESLIPKRYTHAGELTEEVPTREFAEITVPVPWGHISGKWFGPQNVRPILGLHGWMDNAGTFDRLAPLLPPNVAFLSIDLPGHGLSSRLPDGIYYNLDNSILVIRLLMNQYGWDKVSIIGHSMSAIIAFIFAALFPDKVDMIICIDALKPHQRTLQKTVTSIGTRIEEFLKEDIRNRSEDEPPSYTYDELIERLFHGTFHWINKEHCKHMLARNIQKSEKHPDKYFFCRDHRIKYYNFAVTSQALCIEMAKQITAGHMFIKAKSSSYFEDKMYYDEVLEVLLQKEKFEYFEAEGLHHLHLNNPEDIIKPIVKFIEKYGPQPNEKKSSKL